VTAPVPGPFLDPDATVPAEVHRRAARVVVIDDAGRVLLERVRVGADPAQGTWWELPGGGLERGESTADAAARELREETGYLDVEVGPAVATVRVRYRGQTRVAEQHEVIHAARLRSDAREAAQLEPAEVAGLLEVAWVEVDELSDGRRLEPPRLATLVRDVVDGVLAPRRLPDHDCVGWSDEAPDPSPLPDGAAPHLLPEDEPTRVVRDAAPWTPAVHAWLAHCHAHGLTQVPEPLGVDAYGREAVTFVPGAVTGETGEAVAADGARRWPVPLRSTDGLAAVGRLLGDLRAAAAGFDPPPDLVWRGGPMPRRGGEVVCHGDVGHANLVWREDGSPALIDWEFAHPGPPLRDLAEAACWLVPLTDFDHAAAGFEAEPDRHARLRALADGSGVLVADLLTAIDVYLDTEVARVQELGARGIAPWDAFLASGQPAGFARVRSYLDALPELTTPR
jgi:8-oxo-dGTP pyrophosphatase MutT (NUDIX family)